MTKRYAKPLCVFLALVMLAGIFTAAPITVSAADENPIRFTGKCGTDDSSDVEFFCYKDSSMAIFGTANMRNYEEAPSGASTAPWYGYDFAALGSGTLFMTKIAVEYGVTSIGDYSFFIKDNYEYKSYIQLYNVDIANTVTYIGKYAFYNQVIEHVVIPPSVTHIGENAFKKCSLKADSGITYYGNPSELTWDTDGDGQSGDTEFSSQTTVHILDTYSSRVTEFNEHFAYKNIKFVADMDNPYSQEGLAINRNIAAYYGSVNSHVFAGAAPFIIVGNFGGKKKSVTYGSNGFASCVKQGSDYYILTNNATGALNKATIISGGKATGYETPARSDLELKISHTYIGTNTVKMTYTLKNKGENKISNLAFGGTGDIKIGADDKAAIEPLTETVNNASTQVGFYMKSGQAYDKSESGDDYATLGFIGKNVSNDATKDARFFYGEVAANITESAVGSKTLVLLPERIFTKNDSKSQETGSFNQGKDSGMSFYWDGISLAKNETAVREVLFSVYGATGTDHGQGMITEKEATFHTVTWENFDHTVMLQQLVKHGDIPPAYTGAEPIRPRDKEYTYTFSGWGENSGDPVTADTVITAQYTPHDRLFKGHSLSLEGDIGVYFLLNVTQEQVTSGQGVTVTFDWYSRHSEYKLKANETTEINGRTYYKARCNVAAAEMAYNIHAKAFINGVLQDETNDYSVRQYGEDVIKSPAGTFEKQDKLVSLVKEMLNYGAKAQVVFDRIPDNPANGNVTGYSMNTVTAKTVSDAIKTPASDMKSGTNELGLQYVGSSIIYLTETTLRHYYKVTNRNTFNSIKSSANFEYGEKGSLIYFDKKNIASDKLDEAAEFKIGGKSYYYSALNYCVKVLESNVSTNEKKLAIAAYWYNDAANKYFG